MHATCWLGLWLLRGYTVIFQTPLQVLCPLRWSQKLQHPARQPGKHQIIIQPKCMQAEACAPTSSPLLATQAGLAVPLSWVGVMVKFIVTPPIPSEALCPPVTMPLRKRTCRDTIPDLQGNHTS